MLAFLRFPSQADSYFRSSDLGTKKVRIHPRSVEIWLFRHSKFLVDMTVQIQIETKRTMISLFSKLVSFLWELFFAKFCKAQAHALTDEDSAKEVEKTAVDPPQDMKSCDEVKSSGPIAVNYHFSRKCNYACGFCFHTAKNSDKLPLDQAKAMIKLLAESGCKKLNFAGGEPFLPDHSGRDNYLGEMVKYAKTECNFESVSIISNAFFIKEHWFLKYAQYLDILGVSCDSADCETNIQIGRGKDGKHTDHVRRAAELCRQFGVKFKLNTVVNRFNHTEDMSAFIREVNPMRWKIFQVLGVEGENNGRGAKRDVAEFLISNAEFSAYVERHRAGLDDPEIMKIEDNDTMQASYVLVDEHGCFLDCSTGAKLPTRPILEVGVQAAWAELTSSQGGGFNEAAFTRREGIYDWTRIASGGGGCSSGAGGAGGGGDGGGGDGLVDLEDLVPPARRPTVEAH